MERRDLLRVIASATALTLLPNERALAAWARVSRGASYPNGLSDAQLALVRALADTLIPRTDTPSATDVGTHRFIDVLYSEYASDDDRAKLDAALEAMDARARSESNLVFADLTPEARGKIVESMETGDRKQEPAAAYWRLKGAIVHGYFTSEPVWKNVLKVQVMPGRFDGSVPVRIEKRPATEKAAPSGGAARMGAIHHG